MNIDHTCRLVLMSAYLYYKRDTQVLSDQENDELCKLVAKNWRSVPSRYKPLLAPDGDPFDLLTTSHHCLYSRQVEGGALAWLQHQRGEKLQQLGEGYYEGQT